VAGGVESSPGGARRPSRTSSPELGSHPAGPQRNCGAPSGETIAPAAAAATRMTSVAVEVPVGARPGEVVRITHAGLMLPVRMPPRTQAGSVLRILVPAAAAAQALGVSYSIGDEVEVDLLGTDVHGLVGRVAEFQVEHGRVAVELGGRVLGFAPSSLRTAPRGVPQPIQLLRHISAPPAISCVPSLSVPAEALPAPSRTAAAGDTMVVAALPESAGLRAGPPPLVLERSRSLAEACVGERFGAYPPHELERAPGTCAICFYDKEVFRLCETDDCTARFCSACATTCAGTMMKDAFYAMPFLRCPGCRARVQTGVWQSLAGEDDWNKYLKVGNALMEFRCGSCHQSKTLWETHAPKLREAGVFNAVKSENLEKVRNAWQQFSRAQMSPEDLLLQILTAFRGLPAGGEGGVTVPDNVPIKQILGLIVDDERRLALHLAVVREFPRIITFCCGATMCFGCKTSWHRGKTCKQMRLAESGKDVQFCPGCGVATVKSEGCNHMVCVCGRHWQWGANPLVRRLMAALVRNNLAEIRAINANEAVAVEALQSTAWDGHSFDTGLPALLESAELQSSGFFQEVWRITVGMGRCDAMPVLRHLLARWPPDGDIAQLWAVALSGRRAYQTSHRIDLEGVLREVMDRGGRSASFLAAVWNAFVCSGQRAIQNGCIETSKVLSMILDHGGQVCDTDLLVRILNASSSSKVVGIIAVLEVILARAGSNAAFVAGVWDAVLGSAGAGLNNLCLEPSQVDEAFQLILKHCGGDARLLAVLLGPASAMGHISSMRSLLGRRVDANAADKADCPALVLAAGAAKPEAVQLLLASKASIGERGFPQGTALHAVLRGATTKDAAYDATGDAGDDQIIIVKYRADAGDPENPLKSGPARDIMWKPRPRPLAPIRGSRAAARGHSGPSPPAGAYVLGTAPAHPTVVVSTRPKGVAERAGVRCGDVLVEVRNEHGMHRREVDLAKADATTLVSRLALPATLVLRRGFKARLAAVEQDWQSRISVVSLLCAGRADVFGPMTVPPGSEELQPLLVAARAGIGGVVASLLQHGAAAPALEDASDMEEAGSRLAAALRGACRGGHLPVVDLLLERRAGLGPEAGIGGEPAPLYHVARHLRADPLLWSPDLFDKEPGERLAKLPILQLDWQSRTTIVKRLCAARADPDACGSGLESPLFWAAEVGCIDVMQLLVKQGATLRGIGLHALQRAAAGVRADIVRLLLDVRASPNAIDTGRSGGGVAPSWSPLTAAASGPPVPRTETVDQRQRRKREWSVRLGIVRQLLEADADVTFGSGHEEGGVVYLTPLRAACALGHSEIVELLLDHRAIADAAALLDCVTNLQTWPHEWEDGEEEVEYEEPQPPRWWNVWQKKNWEVAQWRKFRNDRVRRRERRQKRLKLEAAVHEAGTAARAAIVRRLVASRTDPSICEVSPITEAAKRGSSAVVGLLLKLGVPVDQRLQWCPVCRQPVLLNSPPSKTVEVPPGSSTLVDVVKQGDWAGPCASCVCKATWPIAPSPLHSLVAAPCSKVPYDDELLHRLAPQDDPEIIRDLWGFAAELVVTCGNRKRPARAPAWGNAECGHVLTSLVALRAAVDSLLPQGGTMLRKACVAGHVEVVGTLLGLRANPDAMAASMCLCDAERSMGVMPIQAAVGLPPCSSAGNVAWDPAIPIAATCGGVACLPEDIERLIIYESGPPADITWYAPRSPKRASSGAVRQVSKRSGSRPGSPAPGAGGLVQSAPLHSAAGGDRCIVAEVRPDGPAAVAGIVKGDLLVAVQCAKQRATRRDFSACGPVDKMLQGLTPPMTLSFRGGQRTYTYDESPLKALVFSPTEHGHLRVEGLLVTPGRDTPAGGDADAARCSAVMGRIVGSIGGEDATSLRPEEALKRMDRKGTTLSFLSAAAEDHVVRARVEARRLATVELLCDAGASTNVETLGRLETRPLVMAARNGYTGIVGALVRCGARPLIAPLCAACEAGRVLTVDLLLNRRADPDGPPSEEQSGTGLPVSDTSTPLLLAARGAASLTAVAQGGPWKGWSRAAQEAVELGARTREQAARLAVCERLLSRRADANRPDSAGQTAMHWAAATGAEEIVCLLLQLGASPAPPGLPLTPLHAACAALPKGVEPVIELLLEHTAQVDAPAGGDDGATPLLYAVRQFAPPISCAPLPGALTTAEEERRLACIRGLVARGADITCTSPEGCLHAAVRLWAAGGGRSVQNIRSWPIPALILELRAEPDSRDAAGQSPLEVAVKLGATDAVELLLSLEANLELGPSLRAAAKRGDNALVERLLNLRADVDAVEAASGRTALHLAAERRHSATQAALLAAHADSRRQDVEGLSPLHILVSPTIVAARDPSLAPTAVEEDSTASAMAERLLRYGANVNAPVGPESRTPLLFATLAGRPKVIAVLLDWKADVAHIDVSTGGTALHLLMSLGPTCPAAGQMRELVSELVRQSAKVDALDAQHRTPLHYAARTGWGDAMKTLTTKRANVEAKDESGCSPLHAIAESDASLSEALELMRWLVDPRTWDVDGLLDKQGRTPLHYAALCGQAGFLEALLTKNASIAVRDHGGSTPLHLASSGGVGLERSEPVVALLLAARADPQARDGEGRTPLDRARAAAADVGGGAGRIASLLGG